MKSSPTQGTKVFQGVLEELKRVTWPNRRQTIRLTVVIIVICLIVGLYIGIIDIALTKLLEALTKK